jgi:tetratricopeptide (TPR) repeat protein
VSLDYVASVQRERGQLEEALTAYTESLNLARRILTNYGRTPESLRDVSVSLSNVASIQRQRGQLREALTAYTELFKLARRIVTSYGETGYLQDLSVSLNKMARIQRQRGQRRRAALVNGLNGFVHRVIRDLTDGGGV